MSSVKGRKTNARKRPTKKSPRKNARSKTRARGASRADEARAIFSRLTVAASAGFVVILFAVGALLWSGGYFGGLASGVSGQLFTASKSAGFEVKRVTLKGARDTAHADVLDAVGPIVGAPILSVDLDAARARVEELGWVRSAAVARLFPDTIHVSIRERRARAVWQYNGVLNLIDDTGAVIQPVSANAYSHLPMIVGAGAPAAASSVLRALADEPDVAEIAHALVRVGDRRWDLQLRNGLVAKLPDAQRPAAQAAAIGELAQLHKTQALLDQDIEYIDLLDPDRVLIRRRPSSATDTM
ncbi:MAG: cell division protein FtsQ/DivIB [Pseudomonadota bacterium]